MKNTSVNSTLTNLSQLNLSDTTSEEAKNLYQNTYRNKNKRQNYFTRIYGKESKEQKLERALLKLNQERTQIREYKPFGSEFMAVSLYSSKRIF